MGKGNDPNCATAAQAMIAEPASRMDRIRQGLLSMGFPAVYEVGGCVRDELNGKEPKDIDVMVCGVSFEELQQLASQAGKCEVLESKGQLVGVRLRHTAFAPDEEIEIALARSEVSTGAGHNDFDIQPLEVPEELRDLPIAERAGHPSLLEQLHIDLARRDLTVNAIARPLDDPDTLIDPYNGAQDIRDGVLRAVSNDTFRDDPLRCFRVISRMAKDGFEADEETEKMLRQWAGKMRIQDLPDPDGVETEGDPLSQDRVRDELKKALGFGEDGAAHSALAMRRARDWGLLQRVIPEWKACVGFDQQSRYHDLTVDEHILTTLEHADRISADPRVKLALLLHDIGKPATAEMGKDGRLHFHQTEPDDGPLWQQAAQAVSGMKGMPPQATVDDVLTALNGDNPKLAASVRQVIPERLLSHEDWAADRAATILGPETRLRFDRETSKQVRHLIRHHMFSEEREFADRKQKKKDLIARRFLARHGEENAFLLCQLRRCDLAGKGRGAHEQTENFRHVDAFEQALRDNLHHPRTVKELKFDSSQLREMDLPQGKQWGEVLDGLLRKVVDDPSLNQAQWLRGQAAEMVLERTAGQAEGARHILDEIRESQAEAKRQRREAWLAAEEERRRRENQPS